MPEPHTPSRDTSLDGLRGVAALVVVFNHVMVTVPVFADVAGGYGRAATGSLAWWLSYTPLHLFWAGTEAVFIFFVLSGFVLAAMADRVSFTLRAYYPQRLLRLYLPVWGSLLVAGTSAWLVHRRHVDGASWWVNAHHGASSVLGTLHSALVLDGVDFLNNPLWSIVWEMWFSLLLPIYLVICRWSMRSATRTIVLILALGVVMGAGSMLDQNSVRYLPMFALGVLLYLHRDRLAQIADRVTSAGWAIVALSSALLLMSYWMAQASPAIPSSAASLCRAAQVGGAALAVMIALLCPAARYLLRLPPIVWLGARSFSLYLTHDAVVISTVMLLGGRPSVVLTIAVVVPVALILAEVFFRAVERPAHRVSRKVGRRLVRQSSADGVPASAA